MGLKELRVSHWQPLAELGLEEKINEKNKLKEKKEKNFKKLKSFLSLTSLPFPQHHPYLVFAATHDAVSGRFNVNVRLHFHRAAFA